MTAATIDSVPAAKLPIWRTVKAAYRDTFANLGAFAGAAAVPFLLSLLVDGLGFKATVLNQAGLQGFADSLVIILFEIAWFRFLLLRSAGAGPTLSLFPGRRILPYLGYSILVLLPYIPFALFNHAFQKYGEGSAFAMGLIYLLYAGAFYLQIRFAFAFLWISIDAPGRFIASWRHTRGNGLRLVIACALASLPVFLLGALVVSIAVTASPELAAALESGLIEGPHFWAVLVAGNLIVYFYAALLNSVQAQAFAALTGWVSDNRELLERFE